MIVMGISEHLSNWIEKNSPLDVISRIVENALLSLIID